MAIHSRKNQYLGVNAHLMSILQPPHPDREPSWWLSFHTQYIVYVLEQLNAQLSDNYIAVNQPSLQMLTQPNNGVMLETIPRAITIYQQEVGRDFWREPVTHIEILYFPQGDLYDYSDYRDQGHKLLSQGISLVEVNFLHELRLPIAHLPIDLQEQVRSAYNATVCLSDGRVIVSSFGADEPIPDIRIPLLAKEYVRLDIGQAYQRTFEAGLWHRLVDYEQLPPRFETYSEDDQERIKSRMEIVKWAHTKEMMLE